VHSHIDHLKAILETAKEQQVPHVFIHFFGDGRDTAPKSAAGYAKDLQAFLDKEKVGTVATVVGRYYAMDRDKRWERVKTAVDALVKGDGEAADDAHAAIEARYKKDETDEFLKPIIIGGAESRIKGKGNRYPIREPNLIACQRATRSSSSTTARTACARSSPSWRNSTSPSSSRSRKTSCVSVRCS
jgi:hypothetical protein